MAAICATGTSNPDSSVPLDVRPFPATIRSPAGTTTSADFCPVSSRLAAGTAGAATRQHNRHPGRPPRIRTTTSPYARRVYVTILPVMTGLTFLSRLTQIAPPHTRFVFPGAGIRLGLPSHPASRRRSCLRLGVSTTSSSRGLSPPSDRPCRAYSRRRLRRRVRRSSRRALALGGPARRARAGPAGRQHGSDWHIVMSGRFSMQPTCLVSDAPSRGHRVNSVDAKGVGVSVPAGDDALCGASGHSHGSKLRTSLVQR
jgi:hypothetical protein